MKLLKFNDFKSKRNESVSLNENVAAGKKLLKEIELITRVANSKKLINKELDNKLKDGKRALYFNDFSGEDLETIKKEIGNIKLREEELKSIEKNPDFEKIKKLLEKNPGYVYNFAYFYFVESIPFEEIETTYKKLIEYKDLLANSTIKFDQSFIDINRPNNYEIFTDELTKLDSVKSGKKLLSKMSKSVRDDYKKGASKKDIEDFNVLSKNIEDLLKDADTEGDVSVKSIINGFIEKLFRFNTVKEVVNEIKMKLKSLDNANMVKFYKKIEEVNKKFGSYGADIRFDENGILVLDVKSFNANQILNKHTSHCIANSESQWSSYVESPATKQYYIYNFNPESDGFDGQADPLSVIGITIDQEGKGIGSGKKIYGSSYGGACHDKNDKNISDKIESILKKWEKKYDLDTDIYNDILTPMTKEEYSLIESKKEANRNIVNPNLTIEDISKYVKLGADINKGNGTALRNAVEQDDIEKAKFILDLGGVVDSSDANNQTKFTKSMEMAKTLIEAGGKTHGSLLTKQFALTNLDNFVYLVNAGADPNYNNGDVIRSAISGSISDDKGKSYEIPRSILKIIIDSLDKSTLDFKRRIMTVIFDYGAYEILDMFLERGLADINASDLDLVIDEDDELVADMAYKSKETPQQVREGFIRIGKKYGILK